MAHCSSVRSSWSCESFNARTGPASARSRSQRRSRGPAGAAFVRSRHLPRNHRQPGSIRFGVWALRRLTPVLAVPFSRAARLFAHDGRLWVVSSSQGQAVAVRMESLHVCPQLQE